MPMETILVADDDRVFVRFVTDVLRASGFAVTAAFDATQALMAAQRGLPALVIVDINMPGGTGLGFLEKFRASRRTAPIPAIAVSVTRDETVAARLGELGVQAYLRKPVSGAELRQAVADALGRTEPPAPASPA